MKALKGSYTQILEQHAASLKAGDYIEARKTQAMLKELERGAAMVHRPNTTYNLQTNG